MYRTTLQHPEEGPGQQAWIWVTALPSTAPQRCPPSFTGYALSSRFDLSSEETGVNQLVLDIVETPD